ncbi:MAG: hypothetical protein IJW20_03850 [Clostridia bacterium]|nr:hypothetical protein [Clostridia bacterium]
MIDFHSHILPDIDDGSKSYEESLAMLEEARNVGFDQIISTSHYAIDCYEAPEYKRKRLIDDLNLEANLPNIILGSEIFLTYNIIELLKEYKASTINGTNYVLFELPLRQQFPNLKDVINRLKENNYIPILAHPERYFIVQKNFKLLYELKELGVLFQANYGSIIGKYGFAAKQTVKKMFKNNLISLLGTDAHKEKSIYLEVPKAISYISKYISNSELEKLTTTNAEKILRGEYL